MMQAPPSGRYKIVERGRRLVTIDTYSGAEVGVGSTTVGPEERVDQATRPQVSMQDAPVLPVTPQANEPATTGFRGEQVLPRPITDTRNTTDNGRSTRMIHVAVAAIVAIGFLIVTSLWVVFAVAMFIVPVRQWLLSALKNAAMRYIDPKASAPETRTPR